MLKELRSRERRVVQSSRILNLHSPVMYWKGSGKIDGAASAVQGVYGELGGYLYVLVPMHVKAVGLPHLTSANGEQASLCRSPCRG